ncbi:MAG: nitroreductase family protein [Heliobacteriaceae bacterium]|nr:nitroreductase family protein [Heliobacteriaceae bacterium]
MNDFLELCKVRQSCRNFADKPLEHEKVVKCIEAGRLAPSGCNAQPWSFVAVETPELAAQVAQACCQMGANAYAAGAKAFIVVLEERATLMPRISSIMDSQYFAKNDMGAAAVSICYAAADLGIGSLIIGLFDREKLAEILDIPYDKRFGCVIALGYQADETIRPKQRKPLEEAARFV